MKVNVTRLNKLESGSAYCFASVQVITPLSIITLHSIKLMKPSQNGNGSGKVWLSFPAQLNKKTGKYMNECELSGSLYWQVLAAIADARSGKLPIEPMKMFDKQGNLVDIPKKDSSNWQEETFEDEKQFTMDSAESIPF